MKKKILLGSIIAVALLLLMPSIPAIQQKTIEEGIKQELQEKLDTINLNDLKDIDVLDDIKHPILYNLVMMIMAFRLKQMRICLDIITYLKDHLEIDIIAQFLQWLLLFRFIWIAVTIAGWVHFWNIISFLFGWNWGNIYPYILSKR